MLNQAPVLLTVFAPNKHVHTERRHTLLVMIRTLLPSGDVQSLDDIFIVDIQPIGKLIVPLLGLPCWHVRQGHGSFLTFEFGAPQEIYTAKHPPSGKCPSHSSCKVYTRGSWHLWIYCCTWQVFYQSELLAHSESTNIKILNACKILDGQALTSVELQPTDGRSQFNFDLGGKLKTIPYSADNELDEQWMLYFPDEFVYTYRSDGLVSFMPSDQACEEKWLMI